MSARNDIEVAEPDMSQRRELTRVTSVDMVTTRTFSDASLCSSGRVA
jgi:hypothetical protein